MTIDVWQSFLGWNLIIHWGILLLWMLAFKSAANFIYNIHSHWVPIKRETFNAIHYGGMGLYKLLIFFFLMVPYFVLLIII